LSLLHSSKRLMRTLCSILIISFSPPGLSKGLTLHCDSMFQIPQSQTTQLLGNRNSQQTHLAHLREYILESASPRPPGRDLPRACDSIYQSQLLLVRFPSVRNLLLLDGTYISSSLDWVLLNLPPPVQVLDQLRQNYNSYTISSVV
jgi:hypothetical protein